MKSGAVTKTVKRNTTMPKKIDHDFMSANYDVIDTFPIYGNLEQFRSRIPDARAIIF